MSSRVALQGGSEPDVALLVGLPTFPHLQADMLRFFSCTLASAFIAVAPVSSGAASFDCSLASGVESTVCDDPVLSKLDEALASNYRSMMGAGIGPGAKSSLRIEQRRWIVKRNACQTRDCLLKAYVERVDEVCDIPVITGIHPACTEADDVISAFPHSSVR